MIESSISNKEELFMENEGASFIVKKLWNKDFVLLLQGNIISTIGDLMYSVTIGY